MYRLGKQAATYDKRDFLFAKYRTTAPLPPFPANFGHEDVVAADGWQMLGNGPDETVSAGFGGAGDCVWAGADHETMLWTLAAGANAARFSGANAIADYAAVTGYDPTNRTDPNPTDNGTNVRDALKYRQKTGVVDASGKRYTIGAYLALELGNFDQLYEAMYLFGVVGVGFRFPASAMQQFDAGQPWSVVPGPDPRDGHYVPMVAKRVNLECVSWGRIQQMTPSFYTKYVDEAWAILSPDLLNAGGKSPEGFDLAQLQADLNAL
jgi:hypothetical protein